MDQVVFMAFKEKTVTIVNVGLESQLETSKEKIHKARLEGQTSTLGSNLWFSGEIFRLPGGNRIFPQDLGKPLPIQGGI